jgi:3-oxoacyl-[acyl-carrier protein] reductase
MKDLRDRVALVTGGSRGIGAAVAIALAGAGADVAVNFRERADAANAVCGEIKKIGKKAISVQADVSVAADVKRMVADVEAKLGCIDILVNNAGIAHPRKLEEITETEWDEVLTVNLKSVFLVTQAVIGGMRQRKWGRIINLSSVAAQTGGAVGAHYAASKAGIIGLTHSCASGFVKDGITVNAIAPALIETDMVTSNPNASPALIPKSGEQIRPNEAESPHLRALAPTCKLLGRLKRQDRGRFSKPPSAVLRSTTESVKA